MVRIALTCGCALALVIGSGLGLATPSSAQTADQPVDPGAAIFGAVVGGVLGAAAAGAFGGHHKMEPRGLDRVVEPGHGKGTSALGHVGGAGPKMGGGHRAGEPKLPHHKPPHN